MNGAWDRKRWFPTGGSKTEAYLGLTALTIFYRRLAHLPESSGTAVIMRYTLRLLAAQQFTRAATLICACEYIRDDSAQRRPQYKSYPLGDEPVTIGLWIGSDHTPNTNDEAKKHLRKLINSTPSNLKENKDRENVFQVLKCPWCGTKLVKDCKDRHLIGEFGYSMRDNRHFEICCPQESCYFNPTKLMIPKTPREFDAASREGLMFETLTLLSDNYYVFHSFSLTRLSGNTITQEETDFLVFNPDKGIFVLKQKRGA